MASDFDKFKKNEKINELRDVLKGKKEAQPASPKTDEEETPDAPQKPTPPGLRRAVALQHGAQAGLPEADRSQLDQEIGVLEEKLKTAENQIEEEKDKYLRLLAEFENFRKRMEREKDEVSRFANEKILQEIFPVVDHLEMTLSHAAQASVDKASNEQTPIGESGSAAGVSGKTKAILEGVGLVLKQLEKSLEKFGLKKVGVEGERFDPHRHEAIGQVESGDYKPGTVVQVHRGGFTLHDRLVRPALVTIAREAKETLH